METLFDRVKSLADSRGKTIIDIESDLGLSKNYLYKWKRSAPNSTKLLELADYFNVSTDYLLGRESTSVNIQGNNSGMAGSNSGSVTINNKHDDYNDDIKSIGAVHLAILDEIRDLKRIVKERLH